MSKSTGRLTDLLNALRREARQLGLTDTEWAARAGVRKETLSRLRGRQTCDFATLLALAEVVGVEIGTLDSRKPGSTPDGHFPVSLNRDYEERLAQLCVSGTLNPETWTNLGPRFFMAGLAVMLASTQGYERRGLLALAEQLHPGASEPAVFNLWLERSPLRPTRFLPLLEAQVKHAA